MEIFSVGFVLGIIMSPLWGLFLLGFFGCLGILCEHNEAHGWSIFLLLLAAGIAYLHFSLSLSTLGIWSALYIIIGVLWSFWRYKRYAEKEIEEVKARDIHYKNIVIEKLHPKEMLGTITSWIIVWPFSMIENVIGDIIDAIKLLVTRVFRAIYYKIYESAIAQLK